MDGEGMNVKIENIQDETGRFSISAYSGMGKRESQQDSAYCRADNKELYAVVCDGMGGLEDGGRASQTAIRVAEEAYLRRKGQEKDPSWMADVVLAADREVCLLKGPAGESVKAGSTLVSVWIREGKLYWCSVGDSRLYLFRGSEVVQATTDLNYFYLLDARRDRGEISQEKYRQEAVNGEALISFCGVGDVSVMDRNVEPLQLLPGDIILLCTDGLYRTIDEKWMQDIFTAAGSVEEASVFIPQIVEEHGTDVQDNFTYIMIQVKY